MPRKRSALATPCSVIETVLCFSSTSKSKSATNCFFERGSIPSGVFPPFICGARRANFTYRSAAWSGAVVVEGNAVHAVALGRLWGVGPIGGRRARGERVEDDRQGGGQRLALAGLHLGDLPVVERHPADQLHVEVAHAHRSPAHLAD